MPTIERLSLEIETSDMEYSDGYRWKELLCTLPYLSRLDVGLKIWMTGEESSPIDVTPYIESFVQNDLPVCFYADSRVLFIDTIPYDFDSTTGVMTSPRASNAKATNMKLFHQRARRVNTLCFDGRHEPTSANDWLQVMSRFSRIQVLDIVSINVSDQTEREFSAENNKQLVLPNLTILRYIRSTKCKVNIPFFMLLTDNDNMVPRLRTLTMMYGDLIYLCKRLPIHFCFKQMKELCVYCNGADGLICLKDIQLLLKIFPNLEHFWAHVQSSRLINRNIEVMIEKFICSLTHLISFRLSCKKDSLKLPSFDDNTWIRRICGLNNPEQTHIIIGKKEIAIWK
jgi:hypothetical protein